MLAVWDLEVYSKNLQPVGLKYFYDYSGITHVHSSLSSGSGTAEHIIESAQNSNVDFIYLTDLNNFKPQRELEGYHNQLMVFAAGEYNYLDAKLLNYHRTTFDKFQSLGQAQISIAEFLSVKENPKNQGIFVLSHPSNPRFQWDGEYPPGLNGIEVVNLKTVWETAWLKRKLSFLWSLFIYPFNPELSLIRLYNVSEADIALWDKLNKTQSTLGIMGSDAEAKMFMGQNNHIKFPSYEFIFSFAKNHVLLKSELTGNFATDRANIENAIRQGQFYFSLDILSDPKGFEVYVKDTKNNIYPLGSKIILQSGMELFVHLPHTPTVPVNILIFKDGVKISNSGLSNFSLPISSAGNYRVVVKAKIKLPFPDKGKWIDWIYTNPFYFSESK